MVQREKDTPYLYFRWSNHNFGCDYNREIFLFLLTPKNCIKCNIFVDKKKHIKTHLLDNTQSRWWIITAKKTTALQSYRIQDAMITSGLIASSVRIKIDVSNRLTDTQTTAHEWTRIRVNRSYEFCICRIESNHRWSIAKMRLGRIESCERGSGDDKQTCCAPISTNKFVNFRNDTNFINYLRKLRLSFQKVIEFSCFLKLICYFWEFSYLDINDRSLFRRFH